MLGQHHIRSKSDKVQNLGASAMHCLVGITVHHCFTLSSRIIFKHLQICFSCKSETEWGKNRYTYVCHRLYVCPFFRPPVGFTWKWISTGMPTYQRLLILSCKKKEESNEILLYCLSLKNLRFKRWGKQKRTATRRWTIKNILVMR